MTRTSLYKKFVRRGFYEAAGTDDTDSVASLLGDIHGSSYELSTPITELINEIRNDDSPFIIFVDSQVRSVNFDLQKIDDFLISNINTAAITLQSKALQSVYGWSAGKLSVSRFKRHSCSINVLPSWFSIINRAYLEKSGVLDSGYKTLEFILMALAAWSQSNSRKNLLLKAIDIEIDPVSWARDILLTISPGLSDDYRLFSNNQRTGGQKSNVPPQFRVVTVGDYGSLSSGSKVRKKISGNETPLFSIICPAFKSRFFEEMIVSILQQTFDSWELIIIVDGPPEQERKIIESILQRYDGDRRISYSIQDNMGTGPTRRLLAKKATGDYIMTIDDDDMLHPDTLRVFADAISRYPDVSVFRGGAQLFGLVELYLPPRQRILINGISADLFEATQPFAIKRKTLESLGGFEGDKSFGEAGEDSDIFIKIDRAGLKTYLIDKPLYYRRMSTLNQTLSFNLDECLEHLENLIQRHSPDDWKYRGINFWKDGKFIKAAARYKNINNSSEVIAPTRFFDYQTIGDRRDVLIDLEITSLCNSSCAFCPRDSINRKNRFIPMDLIDTLSDQLKNEDPGSRVILCGIGESTLNPRLDTIARKLHDVGATVSITTNGALMDLVKFRKLFESGITEFNFSLNASSAEIHRKVMKMNNFSRIKENLFEILEYVSEHRLPVSVNVSFVYCSLNSHEVFDFVDQWRIKGISNIWIHPVNNRGGLLGYELVDADISSVRESYANDDMVIVDVFQHVQNSIGICKIARSLDFISVDGDMLLCALDYRGSKRIGNLKDRTITQLHTDKLLMYSQNEMSEICGKCYFAPRDPESVNSDRLYS